MEVKLMRYILTHKSISAGVMYQEETLVIDGGNIIDKGPRERFDTAGKPVTDLRGLITMPGFIDTHVHGGNGCDAMDATKESLEAISNFKIGEGCTSFCATTITAPMDKTIAAVRNIKNAMDAGLPGAKILGAFLEGPFINPKYKGAHPEEYILPINPNLLNELLIAGAGAVMSVIIAPELEGAINVIEMLKKKGVQVRLGHSDATLEQVNAAVAAGANQGVHTFNAMSPFHHREPGMVGAIFTNPDIYAELICDLVHVHTKACKALAHAKGPDKTVLVTDCMCAGGLPDGNHKLGELEVVVKDGVSRLHDGTLAGSTTSMIESVRHMHRDIGVPLETAVSMATAAPAKALGLFNNLGSLDIGKSADIIGLDEDLNIRFVMVGGEIKKD
jgi:N-acetylglucosamine-6-phosphate deacetylase